MYGKTQPIAKKHFSPLLYKCLENFFTGRSNIGLKVWAATLGADHILALYLREAIRAL